VWTSAALAAVFWSAPWPFFFSAAFFAFFCWDWIFCCPRAMAFSETHASDILTHSRGQSRQLSLCLSFHKVNGNRPRKVIKVWNMYSCGQKFWRWQILCFAKFAALVFVDYFSTFFYGILKNYKHISFNGFNWQKKYNESIFTALTLVLHNLWSSLWHAGY